MAKKRGSIDLQFFSSLFYAIPHLSYLVYQVTVSQLIYQSTNDFSYSR
jgi:hypothetical protein